MTNETATLVLSNDIKPQWLRVVHALQRASRLRKSPAIVGITVLVDQDGNPLRIGEPTEESKVTLILRDIQPQWLNVVRRLQQMARTQQGIALLRVSVLVDIERGMFQWTSPQLVCFEPKAACGQLIEFLSDHLDDGYFIQWITMTRFFEPKSEEQQFVEFLKLL